MLLMKSTSLFILVFLIALTSCSNENPPAVGNCIRVSLLRNVCGTAVFKILDPAYHSLGETADGEENVFMGIIECSPEDISGTVGRDQSDSLFVEINPPDLKEGCTVCFAIVNYSGEKQYSVRIHDLCPSLPEVEG
jgi:hypothetical protein